jgi:phosphoglycolate phosphatase
MTLRDAALQDVSEARPIVLLFDIDGTLIDSAGAGGGALRRAMGEAFQLPDVQAVALHGRTDLGIMTELLEAHGIAATPANLDRLRDIYFATLPEELSSRACACLPGVESLIARLAQVNRCRLGLLTGNMPFSARLKLEHFRLWHHFQFGIYGDQVLHRPLLAEPALRFVAARVEAGVPSQNIIIVGDTPLDIELASAMGVRSLAVCTGGFAAEELRSAGATHVCRDLSDTDAVLAWLLDTD